MFNLFSLAPVNPTAIMAMRPAKEFENIQRCCMLVCAESCARNQGSPVVLLVMPANVNPSSSRSDLYNEQKLLEVPHTTGSSRQRIHHKPVKSTGIDVFMFSRVAISKVFPSPTALADEGRTCSASKFFTAQGLSVLIMKAKKAKRTRTRRIEQLTLAQLPTRGQKETQHFRLHEILTIA
eukprot:CAMPEP_0203842518 /NCGR_PEP_ID=MMETSP0359-20131031/2040_1 /ASSEMBLY_ACC=CAM_ASM_000338 /TAXON_ID=268821 /ORGANISM="Scrippsiella Hangoei, Strain SHTV-5" /LENGTH=179 /DNA_ID=CAMNT_0050757125 /DNA_START=715 /DNA_END=1251 /DNA_ORIENTATION=-